MLTSSVSSAFAPVSRVSSISGPGTLRRRSHRREAGSSRQVGSMAAACPAWAVLHLVGHLIDGGPQRRGSLIAAREQRLCALCKAFRRGHSEAQRVCNSVDDIEQSTYVDGVAN